MRQMWIHSKYLRGTLSRARADTICTSELRQERPTFSIVDSYPQQRPATWCLDCWAEVLTTRHSGVLSILCGTRFRAASRPPRNLYHPMPAHSAATCSSKPATCAL